ncbi:TonB-dependent receptor plug (plasmid) [Fibrella aestuarina BUZ 2]|uniref:TonB-dependent receptor plug n=1 Tax=Fibrella aestuarina BUZ 2 TaxID=1166018 RepID=I0KHA5_9BACT|nr:outer membrane beta-barrel protein [Fibrella aestuarina]CCH03508.1 TonB-dependent receptor plug [Fibrella aestuarina BUZ 2]
MNQSIRFLTVGLLYYVLSTLWFCSVSAQGQFLQPTGELSGQVLDAANQQPLPFAAVTVRVAKAGRDTLVGGTTADAAGHYVVQHLPLGTATVLVSFVGYETASQAITLTDKPLVLAPVSLRADATLLKEVKVQGEKSDLSLSAEKRVFNVGKNLTSVGNTAEALLRSVPSITIDESGNASLRNMATTIYVNGKPTQLTLAQIPANQIESVEVITNPSARYDASTSGGIVNLVLKRNREAGYNGMVSVGLGQNHRYDATANLDWHEGRWNVTTLYSFNATQNPLTGYVSRVSNGANGKPTSFYDQNTNLSLNNTFHNGRLAIDYAVNPRNVFTVAGTVASGAFNTVSAQTYTFRDAVGNRTAYGGRNLDPQNNFTNLGAEFDWKHSFARKGQELTLLTSLTRNQVSNAANWLTTAYNAESSATPGTSQPTYPERDRIDGRIIGTQRLVQLDYVHPLSDSAKWEFGVRSYTYNRDTKYFFNQLLEGSSAYVLLPTYSQDADIRETVNAVYALYSKKLRSGIDIQAGLRLEQSSLHGLSRFDGSTFGYNYPSNTGQNWFKSFFPSFSATKKLSEASELNFSLSRKVGRPNFRHLFVGIQANDRQNITIGNPAVRPEFINTAELTYTCTKGPLQSLSTAYYIYEDHTIKPFTSPLATDSSILVTTFINVNADIQYGIDQTLKLDIGKKLSLTGNVNLRQFTIQSSTISNSAWVYNAKLILTYRFPAGVTAQVSGFRDSRGVSLQGYRLPVNALDLALRKGFWDNRGSIVFTVNDAFNSRRFVSVLDQPLLYQTSMNRREVRFYKLTVQLPLGKPATTRRTQRRLDRPDVDFSN